MIRSMLATLTLLLLLTALGHAQQAAPGQWKPMPPRVEETQH